MAEENNLQSNKMAIIQVLAALIKNPLLFADNSYRFSIDDFPEQFHKIIFGAIQHLANNGMTKIDYIDIDQFLKQYPAQYKVFTMNHGIEYIQKAIQISDDGKFAYYYQSLRKYSLINLLKSLGFDTRDIYDPDIIDPLAFQQMQAEFDNCSVNDLLLKEETKILEAKEIFGSNSDLVQGKAGDGLESLITELEGAPEIGLDMTSKNLTAILRGQRLGCLYMTSAGSGSGKTRIAISEACHLSIPEYYDTENKKWVYTGYNEKVLVINTELELNEMRTMILAFVSGIPEQKILDGIYTQEEKIIRDKARKLIEDADLHIVSITNFDSDDIINTIKKYHVTKKVEYVFFDYLSESVKLLAEGTRKTRVQLRTDQILLQMSAALKDCAKQLGIYIWTASQLSGDYKNAKEPDSTYLRGARSLGDKLDCGLILLPVREIDQAVIETYCSKGFERRPNFVLHVYKARRGCYQNVKVYVYFDRSTCRMYDCFVTDVEGHILEIKPLRVEIKEDKETEQEQEGTRVFKSVEVVGEDFDF